jgi:hypothetical protein
MSDCSRDDIRDLLPELLHDQLDPEERARAEQHLAECADCAAELRLLRSMRAAAFPTPALNVDRIAAAVRESIAAKASADASASADDVTPIAQVRRRVSVTPHADAPRRTRRSVQRGSASWISTHWRIAATIALVAAGAGGFALSRGAGAPFSKAEPETTLAAAEAAGNSEGDAAPKRQAKSVEPSAGAAAAAPLAAVPQMADVAGDAADLSESSLISGYTLSELSESDMEALLQSVDDLEALPELEPHQLPLLASVMEGAL